jgi:F0F1-type ATP synthase assembly protein I
VSLPDPNSAKRDPGLIRYAKFGAVAFEFVGTIAAGVFAGYQLDAYLDTEPWLVAFMTIAATVIGFYRMVQILRRFQRTT